MDRMERANRSVQTAARGGSRDDRRRQTGVAYPRRSSETEQPREKDSLTGLLILQIGICALGLAVLLTARFSGSTSFREARDLAGQLCGVGQEEIVLELPLPALEGFWTQTKVLFGSLKEGLRERINHNIIKEEPPPTIGQSDTKAEEKQTGQGGIWPLTDKVADSQLLAAPDTATFAPYLLTAALRVPVVGTVTSDFGYRQHPITGQADFHTGLDIAAAEGSAIYAALPGSVEEVGWSDSYGNYIRIRHSSNLETRYCHCAEILAKEGENLVRGDRIALVGSTGISTGPHLHFEILIQGKKADPRLGLFPK